MSEKVKLIYLFSAVLLLMGTMGYAQNHAPVISNLTAQQRPGTNLVDIKFDLADADSENIRIRVNMTNNGVPVALQSLSGHVGFNVIADTGRSVVWNAGADYLDEYGEYMVAKVEAGDALTDVFAYSDAFILDTRINKPPVDGWQIMTDSSRSYNENILIDNQGRIWCFYLRTPGNHQPVFMKVMDSEGYVIKSENIVGYASSLSNDEGQSLRAAFNPKTEDVWLLIQGSNEDTHTGYFLIFDELMGIKQDSTIIPATTHVMAPKLAADSSGNMWFSWHTDTSNNSSGSRGAFIKCDSGGEFDPAGASNFTEFGYVMNTDLAIDSQDNIWFLYERAEEAGYIIYNTEKILQSSEIYSTEPLNYDIRRSILADHINETVWALQKNTNTEFYRLNGYNVDPVANFGGINLVGPSAFFINENKRLEVVRYNSDTKNYENSIYHTQNGDVYRDWSTLFSDLPNPASVYDYAAYNPNFPKMKAYLVRTDNAVTKLKLFNVIPESIAVALSADSINFMTVGLDTSKTEVLQIYNTGNSTLQITDIFTTNAHFTVDKTVFSIAPEQSQTINIAFTPTDLKIVTSSLKIYSNAAQGIQTVKLVGEGYQRMWSISVDPDTLSFEPLGIGYSSEQTFEVKNTGTERISIRSISVNNSAFLVDDTPFSISAGDSQSVEARFEPKIIGPIVGRALISSSAASEVDSVIFKGVGTETIWSMRTIPDTVDFDLVPIGYTSRDTFIIKNTGTEPFEVDSISVGEMHFSIIEDFNYRIEAGDSHFVPVTFSPTHTELMRTPATIYTDPVISGIKVSTISGVEKLSNEDNIVTLSGIGYYLNAPKIEINPLTLKFDSVRTNSSKTLYVKVRNSGSEILSITNILSTDNQFAIEDNKINFNVEPGEILDVGIVFTPKYGIMSSADVKFYSNDPIDEIMTVQVSGQGFGAPDIYVNPSAGLIFSEAVIVGNSSQKSFYISNIGADTLFIPSISIDNTQFKAIYDTLVYGRSPSIAPPPNDRALFISVTFSPEMPEAVNAIMTIENNDPDTTSFKYPLFGTGRLPGPPQIAVSPDQLNFGVVDFKGAKQLNLKIANRGESPLEVSKIESDDMHFTTGFDTARTISGNDSIYIAVQFIPDSSRQYEGTLRIYSNDPEYSPLNVQLQGEGRPLIDQHIVVSPEELNFGELAAGQSSTKYFWVYNTGEKPLTVSDIMSSEPEVTVNRTAFTVYPGAYQYVAATFRPLTPGTVLGNIAIINNDPDNNIIYVTYSGQGRELNPAIISTNMAQNTVVFGTVALDRSVSKYVKIYNTGETILNVSDVTTGNSQYTVNSRSFSIYPNSYRWLYVTFSPKTIGTVNSELTIFSDASNSRSITLSLTGSGRLLTPANISLSHSKYNFGETGITTERSFYLRVSNSGEDTLSVNLSHQDTAAFRFNLDKFNLLSGHSQHILVFFRPNAVGSYQDSLRLDTNDPEHSVMYVLLSGIGREIYDQKINVDPEILSFDSVGVGLSRSKTIWIANDGEKDLVIQNIYTSKSVYTLDNHEITITPGNHRYIYVSFKPTAQTAYNDTLFIENNDPGASLYKLPVIGYGRSLINPRIVISPSSLNYGNVALQSSVIQNVNITNTGERLLQINGISRTDRENFWIPAEQQSFSIEPNQTKSISVEFKPIHKKTFDDSLIIASNDPSNPNAVIQLNGVGRDSLIQHLVVQPDSLMFAETAVGYGTTIYLQLRNAGEKRLTINEVVSDNEHFTLSFKSFHLNAYETREIGVTFTPTMLEQYEGMITIGSDDPEFPSQSIKMRGSGRNLRNPQLITNVDSLGFGQVNIGSSRQLGFYLSNGGDLPLIVYGTSSTAPQFTIDYSDSITITGGSSRLMNVTFSPSDAGSVSGILTIQTNAGTKELKLTGEGLKSTLVPTISVSPAKLDFGTLAVNMIHSKTLWISNIGYDTLRVTNIISDNSSFYVLENDMMFNLAQSMYRVVNVYFSADSVKTASGTIRILTNDPNNPEIMVTASAASRNLLDAKIYIVQDSLNFGVQALNYKSGLNLMIHNSGEKTLEITNVLFSDDQFSVDNNHFSISPKSYYYLPVYFQPGRVGESGAVMTIVNGDATNDSLNISLKGTGRNLIPQSISVSADSLNFETTVINRSRSRSFYVINNGEVSLEVSEISIDSDQFIISADNFVVAPGDSQYIALTYNPTRTDTLSIDLLIRNNDSDAKKQILSIPVKAQCIKYDGPQLSISTTNMNFGDVLLGSRKTQSFYVVNHAADSSLNIINIEVAQYFSSYYTVSPVTFTVAPGDSQLVHVTFYPNYLGYFNTELSISHNDEFAESDNVRLYGRAIQDAGGINVLSTLSGWQLNGYYPFSNVLKNGPDNAWFIKDFYLQAIPKSAQLYVSFKDSVQIFINGSYVYTATSDTMKRIQSWNISDLDVSDYLTIGRNRITAYVSNKSGQSGFDCVLLVDNIPIIRHGGFYPDEASLWYYYGVSGVRTAAPASFESRTWYSFEFGWSGVNDIIADWDFELGADDTTYDSSVYGRKIETQNVQSVLGIVGNGIQFSGDNTSFAKIMANMDGVPNTVQLWIYSYGSLNRNQYIVNNGRPGYNGNGMYIDNKSALWINFQNGSFSTGYTLLPDKWYLLTVKYESNLIRVYVNNRLISSYTYIRGLPQGDSYTYVGANPKLSTAANGFFGIIDELKILNHTEGTISMPDIMSLAYSDTSGIANQTFNLNFSVEPSPFQLINGVVQYALGGYDVFKQVNFSVTDSNNVGSEISIQIPGQDIQVNGLKCKIHLETDYGTITYPEPGTLDSLIWIPVRTIGESTIVKIDTVFKMFSIPYALDDKSVASVFTDDIGEYSPYSWRLFQWNSSENVKDYVEYMSDNWVNQPGLEQGRAVWIVGAERSQFDAGSGWSPKDMESFRIELSPGWNQISNPYPFPVAWDDVQNKSDAVSDLVYYETGNGIGYERNWQMMMPWEGYFIENKDSTSVRTLYIPPAASSVVAKEPLAKRYESESFDPDILINIDAHSGQYFDHDNVMGVMQAADNLLDNYDMAEPPPIGKYVGLWIDNSDWKKSSGNYSVDMRKSGEIGYFWRLRAESNLSKSGQSMVLKINQSNKLPEDWKIFLFDLKSDIALDLNKEKVYSFGLESAKTTVRHLKLVLGTEAYVLSNSEGIPLVPLHFTLYQNYPNPFNPATTIEFNISKRTPVEIRIFNILGQQVRILKDEVMRGGKHKIIWDGFNESGQVMTSGLYFVRLKAEGKQSIKKMMLVR